MRSPILVFTIISLSLYSLLPFTWAVELTDQPLLRLNTEMHVAKIIRIDSEATGKTILTCSNDKTAKLWDATDGRLLKTLKVPMDAGYEGRLSACSLSPDGTVAAVGGYTRQNVPGNHNTYFFDTASGDLLQRLKGLGNVTYDLEFHTNRILAAALGNGEGIRIFQKNGHSFQETHRDMDYGDNVYNLSFVADGRLATVCDDGHIRLYDSNFTLIKKVATQGGETPFNLAFSSDGS
ncbi:MAG: hypothetical protein PVI90_04245 [Desulfobacteraceae bacterium]|jgi:WD40 repeat protein